MVNFFRLERMKGGCNEVDDILRILREVVADSNQTLSDGTERSKMICFDIFKNWKMHVVSLFISVVLLVSLRYISSKVDRPEFLFQSIAKMYLIAVFFFLLCSYYKEKISKSISVFVFWGIIEFVVFFLFLAHDSFFAGIGLWRASGTFLAAYLFFACVIYLLCFARDVLCGLPPFARKKTWIDAKDCQARRLYDMQLSFLKKTRGGRVSLNDLIAVRRGFALSGSRIKSFGKIMPIVSGSAGVGAFYSLLKLMGIDSHESEYFITFLLIAVVCVLFFAAIKSQEEIDDYLACLDFAIDRLRKNNGIR